LKFVTTVNIVTPYLSPCNSDHPNNFPAGQKAVTQKKSHLHFCINSFDDRMLSHDHWLWFFFGRLRVPTRRCDLVVPADWGWGRQPQTVPVATPPSTTTNGKLHAHLLSKYYGIYGDTPAPDNRTAAQPQFFLVSLMGHNLYLK